MTHLKNNKIIIYIRIQIKKFSKPKLVAVRLQQVGVSIRRLKLKCWIFFEANFARKENMIESTNFAASLLKLNIERILLNFAKFHKISSLTSFVIFVFLLFFPIFRNMNAEQLQTLPEYERLTFSRYYILNFGKFPKFPFSRNSVEPPISSFRHFHV